MSESAVVTLLFTDLVRSTELLDRLGDEAVEPLRRTHFRLLRDAVTDHGGAEVKSLGDGLMAVFPGTVDGLSCAKAVQRAVSRHNRAQPELALHVRIGVHVGEPIQDEADYFGTSVVVARRLCELAEGGQVLASALVRELVAGGGDHRFGAERQLAVKGLAEPLGVSTLEWDVESTPRLPLPPPLAGPPAVFVGREEELALLRGAWHEASAGTRQAVFLTGEPGIGKTQLAAEFARELHAEGAIVVFGRCDQENLLPYQPFVDALRQYLAGVSPAVLAELPFAPELARLVPDLAWRLPAQPAIRIGEGESERYRVFEAVSSLLASADAPVLLVLGDLHWADKPELLLLRHLLRATAASPMLLIGTYRDTDVTNTGALADLLADLHREGRYARIQLRGLSAPEMVAMFEATAGHNLHASERTLAEALYDETQGNPFFFAEILRHLIETGAIEQRDGKWTAVLAVEQMGIPLSLAEVIGRRMDRLSEVARRALVLGAVVGQTFDLATLEELGELSSDELLDALDESVHAKILVEVSGVPGRVAFSHTLMRQTLYAQLSDIRRVRLHRRVGEALERLAARDGTSRLAELAHHFVAAAPGGDVEKAWSYARRAGDHALGQLAYEEAVKYYESGLEVLELARAADLSVKVELLLSLGEACWSAGHLRRARGVFLDAFGMARASRDPEFIARSALSLGFANDPQLSSTDGGAAVADEATVAALEAALATLPEEDSPLRARVLARLALVQYWSVPLERRETLTRAAVEMAERVDDQAALADALHDRRQALWGSEDLEARLAVDAELIRLSDEAGDAARSLQARLWRINDLLELGDIVAVDAEIARFARLAEELRQPVFVYYAQVLGAMRALLVGQFAEAERLAEQTLGAKLVDAATPLANYGAQALWAWREQGRVAELESAIQAILEVVSAMPAARAGLAFVLSEVGRLDEARDVFEQLAEHDFADFPRDSGWFGGMVMLTLVCAAIGDARRARPLYELLLPVAGRTMVVYSVICMGPACLYLGLLARTMGDLDRARNHFERALETAEAMGSPPFVAHAQCALAETLAEATMPGDPQVADLIERGLATANALGMTPLAGRLLRLSEQSRPVLG